MAPSSRGFGARLLHPQKFFGAMNLRTGTEIIALSMLFNQATGVYGLMAILTGYAISAGQLTMYIYSLAALGLVVWLIPHIRRQEAFHSVGLAWLYALDTIIHTAFTAAFAADWYGRTGEDKSPYSGRENMASLALAVLFTVLRVYCSLVVGAFARQTLRQDGDGGDEPFAEGSESGMGWKGRMGRAMVSVGRGYWTGTSEDDYDDDWRRSTGYKFVSGGAGAEDDDGGGGSEAAAASTRRF